MTPGTILTTAIQQPSTAGRPRQRLLSETLLKPSEAASRLTLADGRVPHVAAVMRWMKKGVKAPGDRVVRLECVRVAGRLMTSAEAVARSGPTHLIFPRKPSPD